MNGHRFNRNSNQRSSVYGSPQQQQQRNNGTLQRSRSFNSPPSNNSYQSSNDSDDEEFSSQPAPAQAQGGKRIRMSDVKMPSGTTVAVTVPAKYCNCGRGRCTFQFRLQDLRPEGQFGGREYSIVASDMLSTIRRHVKNAGGRFNTYNIISIQKVQNCCLWRRFRDCEKRIARSGGRVNEKMLYHGSSAAEDIVQNGFSTDCAKPAGMFGKAIYFAQHSSKSNQYVYGYLNGKGCPAHQDKSCYVCERKLLLCRVVLGKTSQQTNVNRMTQSPPGSNSVKGTPSSGGLRYPEYAIYEPAQAYPEYLITYTIAK